MCQSLADRGLTVIAAYHHRDSRPLRLRRERRILERPHNRVECRFWSPVAGGEPEVPVLNGVAAAVPLVGPGEYEGADAACLECGLDLPTERGGLRSFAVAAAVETDFRHHERPLARNVL